MYSFPIPNNDVTFTSLVCDLVSEESDAFDLWGRNGQRQSGFDIYSSSKGIVIECKWKDPNRKPELLYKELRSELEKHISSIKEFKGFKITKLILATTLNEDTKLQEIAATAFNDRLTIEIWGWKKIERMLNGYPHLIKKYYPHFYFDPDHKKKFTTHRNISESHFSSSQGNIFLNAFIPCIRNKGKGSCVISFKSNELFMLTLTSDDLMDYIEKRKMSIEENIVGGLVEEVDNLWFITLKSSAFYISESEKIELCGILNDFLNEYQKAYENYKKMLGAEKFEITKSNHVKLLTVTKNLWIKMMKFSHEFDFDRGKSEWHIFNQNRVSIIVQGPDSVIYNAWLNTERTESNYNDFLDNEETVDIVWVIPGLTEINKPGVWNATKTYWWLKDQFIPKVLDYYTPLSKRLFSKL